MIKEKKKEKERKGKEKKRKEKKNFAAIRLIFTVCPNTPRQGPMNCTGPDGNGSGGGGEVHCSQEKEEKGKEKRKKGKPMNRGRKLTGFFVSPA